MKPERAAAALRQTSLFGELDDGAVRRISERAIARTYRKNDLIFHEGDAGESLFVVAEGLVKVYVTSGDGGEMVLATLTEGDIFGELAVISGARRSASARALQPTTLLALTRATFTELVRDEPSLVTALFELMGKLLRRMLMQASDLVFLDLPGRVAKLLLEAAEEKGEPGDDGIAVDLGVSQTDLAAMVGGSRPSVNQILRQFEERGYLTIDGKKVVIRDMELLKRRAAT